MVLRDETGDPGLRGEVLEQVQHDAGFKTVVSAHKAQNIVELVLDYLPAE